MWLQVSFCLLTSFVYKFVCLFCDGPFVSWLSFIYLISARFQQWLAFIFSVLAIPNATCACCIVDTDPQEVMGSAANKKEGKS